VHHPVSQKSISLAGRLSGLAATPSHGTNTQGDRPRLKLVVLPLPSGPSSGSAAQQQQQPQHSITGTAQQVYWLTIAHSYKQPARTLLAPRMPPPTPTTVAFAYHTAVHSSKPQPTSTWLQHAYTAAGLPVKAPALPLKLQYINNIFTTPHHRLNSSGHSMQTLLPASLSKLAIHQNPTSRTATKHCTYINQ
jgi:hypothetical protein